MRYTWRPQDAEAQFREKIDELRVYFPAVEEENLRMSLEAFGGNVEEVGHRSAAPLWGTQICLGEVGGTEAGRARGSDVAEACGGNAEEVVCGEGEDSVGCVGAWSVERGSQHRIVCL